MKTIRFIAQEDKHTYYGIPQQNGDIGNLLDHGAKITANVLTGSPLSPSTKQSSRVLTVQTLLSPLSPEEIGTIRGMGAQFPPLGKLKAEVAKPKHFNLFYKPLATISGSGSQVIIPNVADGMDNDYEVELAVVIGRNVKNVSIEDALDCVAGYTVVNDYTSRGLAGLTGKATPNNQWGIGKSFDGWTPLGPVYVTKNEIHDPQNLEITTTVNGIVTQKSNTSQMLLTVAELISRLSQGVTLEAGSIILSGSPLALKRSTPWLKHGDEVKVTVEKIGTIVNRIVEEKMKAKL